MAVMWAANEESVERGIGETGTFAAGNSDVSRPVRLGCGQRMHGATTWVWGSETDYFCTSQ